MGKTRTGSDDDEITEANVDAVILQAIRTYFDKDMMLDAMFWRTCLNLLQKKYKFTLQTQADQK